MRRCNIGTLLGSALLAWLYLIQPAAASSPHPTPAAVSLDGLAPADEYFGPTHLSILEIRHRIFAMKDNLHRSRESLDTIVHRAATVSDAFYDWNARFPRDPWLPGTGWELATLYEELPGTDAHDRAVALLKFIGQRYPQSKYASNSAKDLARGVGVRPWPGAPPAAVAVASPSHTTAPAAAPSPAHSAAPAPSARPALPAASMAPVADAPSLVAALLDAKTRLHAQPSTASALVGETSQLESAFRKLSRDGTDATFARAAWEIAALYESLPGSDARERAVKMLALIVDRYPSTVYARWSIRDLERGIGLRD